MTNIDTLLNDPDTAGVWSLDPDRSTVNFKIRNFWGLMNVKGRFTDVSGDGQVTGKGAIFGRLDIQVASLRTGIGKRDEHLRSADFFDADRYPDISVVVTAVEPTTGDDRDRPRPVRHRLESAGHGREDGDGVGQRVLRAGAAVTAGAVRSGPCL